jgi:hypothetical protein
MTGGGVVCGGQEKHNPATSDSSLSPYNTGGLGLMRWTSTPVYSLTNTDKSRPDGVLISGDLLNGKTRVPGRTVNVRPPAHVRPMIMGGGGVS